MNHASNHDLSDEDAIALKKCMPIIEAFRKVDQRITSSYMAAFLAVVLQSGKGPYGLCSGAGHHSACDVETTP